MRIERIVGELPTGFDQLRVEAHAEGHHFLDQLASDWASGAMRFRGAGEALLAAYSGDTLVGVGGLTIDPDIPEALRMRRFYVRSGFRRVGIARSIALTLIHQAFEKTDLITLNAAPESEQFWKSLGFVPDRQNRRTHILRKPSRSCSPIELYELLCKSRSVATGEKWLPSNPARGQCSVTALVVQDVLGGDILKTEVDSEWHFYNRLEGRRWDFTMSQFGRPIGFGDRPSGRDEALRDTSWEKYQLLRRRVLDGSSGQNQ